jgi:hypothetical protein
MPPAHARYAKKPRRAPPPEADVPRAPRRQAVLVGVGGAVSDGAGSVLGELRAHRDVQAIRALLVGACAHLGYVRVHALRRAGQTYSVFGHTTSLRCWTRTASRRTCARRRRISYVL